MRSGRVNRQCFEEFPLDPVRTAREWMPRAFERGDWNRARLRGESESCADDEFRGARWSLGAARTTLHLAPSQRAPGLPAAEAPRRVPWQPLPALPAADLPLVQPFHRPSRQWPVHSLRAPAIRATLPASGAGKAKSLKDDRRSDEPARW